MSCACKDEETHQGVLCMPAGRKRLIVQSEKEEKKYSTPTSSRMENPISLWLSSVGTYHFEKQGRG